MQILRSSAQALSTEHRTPSLGQHVRVRGQRWLVADVRSYDDCHLITVRGVEPSNAGKMRRIVAPFEEVAPIDIRPTMRRVGSRCWWRACRGLLGGGEAGCGISSARSARMDLIAYQLEPALAVVRGLGTRLLIADEVGLGKTVQAGLVARELVQRGAVTRALVLTPAGLCDQWALELAERFDLKAAVFGMREVKRRRSCLPPGVNPWTTEPLVVASIDYVKRPEVLRAVASCPWDLVIVDEAHCAAPGTERRAALDGTCGLASYVVLLSATPHHGDPAAFSSLCSVGRQEDRLLVFRRTRADAGIFRERRVHHLLVRPTEAETRMHAELQAFSEVVRSEWPADRVVWLALVTLHKRALSSAHALEQSLRHRLDRCATEMLPQLEQLPLPLTDRADELDASDEAPAIAPLLRHPGKERRMLERLIEMAHQAAKFETKLAALRRLLRRMSEPALVFTEYRDTLLHIRRNVAKDAPIVHGGLSRDERLAAIRQFTAGKAAALFATDAAGEGLNLHFASRIVINLELPWNPMRLEQRIGRVDRIGQERRVHAFHLIAAQTGEVRLLERLRSRVAVAHAAIGAPNPLAPTSPVAEPSVERLVIERRDERPSEADISGSELPPEVEVVRLQQAAALERQRVLTSRSLCRSTKDDEPLQFRATLLLCGKRRRIRSLIGSRIFVLQQSVFMDSAGRTIGSRLLPLLVELLNPKTFCLTSAAASRLVQELHSKTWDDSTTLDNLDPGFAVWADETRRFHQEFWRSRRVRDETIVRALNTEPLVSIQPGLFDRRAEHIWATDRERHAELVVEIEQRIVGARRSTELQLHGPQTALVAGR